MLKLKTKIQGIIKSPVFAKVFASCLILVVLASCLLIPAYAAEDPMYQTVAPISYNNFSGTVNSVAFPGAHSVSLYYKTADAQPSSRGYVNNTDYYEYPSTRIFYKSFGGNSQAPYFRIALQCNYATVYVNGVTYQGSLLSNPSAFTLTDVYSLDFYPAQASFAEGTNYWYYFDVMLYVITDQDIYDQGFLAGKQQGYSEGYLAGSQAGSESNYNRGYDEGYDVGFNDGRNSSDSENLVQNLLGRTLNMPFEALNQFTLFENSTTGFRITLGVILGGCISLTLFIALLKIFAGG